MRVSWSDPLSARFTELVLHTIADEGVVYLSHDGGEGHGRVLGHSVLDFIDRWTLVGCPGPEEWQMAH